MEHLSSNPREYGALFLEGYMLSISIIEFASMSCNDFRGVSFHPEKGGGAPQGKISPGDIANSPGTLYSFWYLPCNLLQTTPEPPRRNPIALSCPVEASATAASKAWARRGGVYAPRGVEGDSRRAQRPDQGVRLLGRLVEMIVNPLAGTENFLSIKPTEGLTSFLLMGNRRFKKM